MYKNTLIAFETNTMILYIIFSLCFICFISIFQIKTNTSNNVYFMKTIGTRIINLTKYKLPILFNVFFIGLKHFAVLIVFNYCPRKV